MDANQEQEGCCYESCQAVTEDLRYQDHLLEDDALEEQDLRGVETMTATSEDLHEWLEVEDDDDCSKSLVEEEPIQRVPQ